MADLPAPRTASGDDGLLTVVCREFVELVTEHLEGTLPPAVEQAVVAHLDLCDPCVVYLEQVRGTAAALRTLPTPTLPPAAVDRLIEVFSALHGRTEDPPRG